MTKPTTSVTQTILLTPIVNFFIKKLDEVHNGRGGNVENTLGIIHNTDDQTNASPLKPVLYRSNHLPNKNRVLATSNDRDTPSLRSSSLSTLNA